MRNTGKIALAVLVVLFTGTFLLHAEGAATPPGAKESDGGASSSASASMPEAPMPEGSMAASVYSGGSNFGTPRFELFAGYSNLRGYPRLASGNRLVDLNGGSASIALNFNRFLGLVGEFGGFNDTQLRTSANPSVVAGASGRAFTFLAGPRLSFRNHERFTPFAQALFGGIHAGQVTFTSGCTGAGCTPLPAATVFALTAGGGLDLRVHPHVAIRLIQAEYLMTSFQNQDTGQSGRQNDVLLSGGLVFRFGGSGMPQMAAMQPVSYSCQVSPSSVYAGDTIAVNGTAMNLDPAETAHYLWSADGGTVTGTSDTASIDTRNTAPGTYTLKGHVSESAKASENADCTATYIVKAYEPPTITCSANPVNLNPGDKSVITAGGVSPQNRPLTYSYSAASGTADGSGASATYDSTGAPAGTVAITCNVSDDKGQTATASTSVTIAPPPPPPAEQVRLETRLALHSVFFPTAQPRVERPQGGLVASQEEILTTLATDFKSYLSFKPDTHLILTGHADVRGSDDYNQELSQRRVARTQQFLVEQGVPEASIETRSDGKDQELTADQVKALVEQNPDLTDTERAKVLENLNVIVLAQNRRVDVTLSTTGQQSVRLYPFNAADAITLIQEKSATPRKQ